MKFDIDFHGLTLFLHRVNFIHWIKFHKWFNKKFEAYVDVLNKPLWYEKICVVNGKWGNIVNFMDETSDKWKVRKCFWHIYKVISSVIIFSNPSFKAPTAQ